MSKRAASAKKVVVLYMRAWMLGLRLAGVGAVMLMTGCMVVLRCKKLGQLIQRMLYRNANSVTAARPSINSRARYRRAV